MPAARFDVIGLGNAIVDVLARAEDDFLIGEGMHKGSMALIDEARAEALYGAIGPAILVSGGSAANTCAGLASLGARAAFLGKVRNDELGRSFAHDLRAAGVAFDTDAAETGPATARCIILVTPDGERTMNTYLGASRDLGPEDVDPLLIEAGAITYLEGYLWDPPAAKAAFRKAAEIARAAGRRVALSLSDSFCVERHRPEFLELLRSGLIDTVFANESEARALYETADLESAMTALRADAKLAIVTRSENGSVVLADGEAFHVPTHPVERVVDATGAGDLFAAGFLTVLAQGGGHAQAARLGSLAAAEVISHMGARPERNLRDLAAESGVVETA